jgi:hypothetical protein
MRNTLLSSTDGVDESFQIGAILDKGDIDPRFDDLDTPQPAPLHQKRNDPSIGLDSSYL